MPLEHLHNRWHFHQRMNKKVWNNLDRLTAILAKNPNKQDILDALHPWRLSILLRFNNTFAILQISIGIILIVLSCLYFSSAPWFFAFLWLISIGLCIYAYLSIEKQSDIDHIITQLSNQVFQDQYQVKFNQFPIIDKSLINPTHLLMRIRQGFDCLNEGNASNSIEAIASTEWQVNGHLYPVLLFHYKCVNETTTRDTKGNVVKKETVSHRWGACVFDMPPLAFVATSSRMEYPRYPVGWSSSDIQFNRKYTLAGQQELELARNLSPQRILNLGRNLDRLRGTIMFHDSMNAFCYVSQQNIFATQKPTKPITDISMLRGYLRTLKAPHYENVKESLSDIIAHFTDDNFFKT